MTVPHNPIIYWGPLWLPNAMKHFDHSFDLDPVGSALAPGQFGGMGRDGSSCGRTYDPYGNTEPWTWLGPEPQTYAELNSSNTTNPDPFTGNIDFNADNHTMGTTPPAGPTATAKERPAVNLGGQTLIYNGQKWVRSQSLQYASALSASGTALTNDFLDPAVWRNGKVAKIKDLCPGLAEKGITSFETIDINDQGVIVIKASFSNRIGILLPVEVIELASKVMGEDGKEIAGSEIPVTFPKCNQMVELITLKEQVEQNRIAHREMKVKIPVGKVLAGKKVTWTMKAWGVKETDDVRGDWKHSKVEVHKNCFEESKTYGKYGYTLIGQKSSETIIEAQGEDGFTAVRANLPPIGWNHADIKVKIEGTEAEITIARFVVPAVVVIDPGHGGLEGDNITQKTTDADGNLRGESSWNNATGGSKIPIDDPQKKSNVLENALTLQYSLRLEELLNQYRGTNSLAMYTYLTRRNNENLGGYERAKVGRDKGADVYLSIHFNAADNLTARGAEVLIRNENQKNLNEDTDFAHRVVDRVAAALKLHDPTDARPDKRPDKPGNKASISDIAGFYIDDAYHPIRSTMIEIEFIHYKSGDKLINGETTKEAVKLSVAKAMRDGIVKELEDFTVQEN